MPLKCRTLPQLHNNCRAAFLRSTKCERNATDMPKTTAQTQVSLGRFLIYKLDEDVTFAVLTLKSKHTTCSRNLRREKVANSELNSKYALRAFFHLIKADSAFADSALFSLGHGYTTMGAMCKYVSNPRAARLKHWTIQACSLLKWSSTLLICGAVEIFGSLILFE